MKKRISLKIILSLLLTLVMLLSLTSTAISAVPAKTDISLTSLSAGSGVAGWLGEKLAGGVVSAIAGKGVNAAFDSIFGSDTDRVLKSLEEIKLAIQDLKSDIAKLATKVDKVQLQALLNDYGNFIGYYITVYDALIAMTEVETDYESAKEFFEGLYSCTGTYENYKVDGNTLINATINLGNRLRHTYVTEGGECNIFGAVDLYDRYTNVWEHNGYALREDFRNKSLGIYTLFSTISQLVCQTMIEGGKTPGIITDANNWAKQLRNDADLLDLMVERCAVIRHPELRIARNIKTGQDFCAFNPDINIAYVTKNAWGDETVWYNDFTLSADRYTSVDYIYSLTRDSTAQRTAWSQGWEVFTNQPTVNEYQTLIDNYDGQLSLYNIFFDADKGNFNNVLNNPNDISFLCNHYVSRYFFNKHQGWEDNYITWESQYHVQPDNSVCSWWYFSAATYNNDGSVTARYFDYSHAFIVNKYTGELKQGALMGVLPGSGIEYEASVSGMDDSYVLPYSGAVNLEVSETGDAYIWSVNKNDGNGFTNIAGATDKTYSIPALDGSMNGWQYSCTVIHSAADPEEEPDYTYSVPVVLSLSGPGVPEPVTEHEVSDAASLEAALEKVDSDEWDNCTLKLTADITYTKPVLLKGMHGLTIDLNGYALTLRPAADSEPNVNPMSDNPQIAAVYLNQDRLEVIDSSTALSGKLEIVAGEGIDFGICAVNGGNFDDKTDGAVDVSSSGGTAVYAEGGKGMAGSSTVVVSGGVRADGENSYGIECINKSSVTVGKNVRVSGENSRGAYAASFNGGTPDVQIKGNLTVSGERSRGILLDADADFTVNGNVTVADGSDGISASKGSLTIGGDLLAPDYAINARGNETRIDVAGDVSVTQKNAVAVSSLGADIRIGGNILSSGSGGIGIFADIWNSLDGGTIQGAKVTADGKITADTPLVIDGASISDEKKKISVDSSGYNIYKKSQSGQSSVRAKPGALEVLADSSGNSLFLKLILPILIALIAVTAGVCVFALRKKRRNKSAETQ